MRNPYIIDRPLVAEDHFFGRERELAFLVEMWLSDQRLVLLYGKPHIGKTSLLAQLDARLLPPARLHRVDWSTVPISAGDLSGRIASAVARALECPLPQSSDPLAGLQACLAERAASPTAQPAVVAIDALSLDECRSRTDWARTVDSLGDLLRRGPVILILAVEARPEECQSVTPGVPSLVLGGLTPEQAEDLLLVPVRGSLTYDLDSMRRIYALTGGEPYLLQLYGHILFERRAGHGWAGLIETEQAIDDVTERAAPQFGELWERCSVRARIMLCIFAEGIGTHGIGSADDIRRRLQRERVEMPLSDVERALDELRQRDLVERLGGGLYRFRNALFLLWLRRNQSLGETVRRSREYKSLPRPSVPPLLNRRIDWVGLSLWVLIAALVIAVGTVWRSRQTTIVWTDAPATPSPGASQGEPAIAPLVEPVSVPGVIAYMAKAESGHYWDIRVMQSDGLDPVRLTRDAADNTGPAWSPDGERLAFVSDRDGNREVYVMGADGSDPVNLTQNAAEEWTPSWSPDGTQIAFASFRDGNWEIYIMDADGANQRRITRSASADYAPAWSPAGDTIAFVSDRSGNLDVYLMGVDGADLRALTTDEATDQVPAWSHDGRQVLWESYRFGNMEIMAIEVAGGEPRNLTQDAYADDHGGTWSPSGTQIAYFSNHDGGWDIFTLDLRTGVRANLTESVAMEQYPVFRPQ
ncbi:MAG: hypothetical protein ACYCYF_01455 [Anaerolineae bacterium]